MKRLICALIGIVFLIVLPAIAQSSLGLSASDFALLTAANAALPTQFAFDYTAKLAVKDLDSFATNVALGGSGVVDRSAPALDMTATGTVGVGTAQFLSLNATLRWVNDRLYLNPGDGWQAHPDAARYAADLISQYAGLQADPTALSHWDGSGIDGLDAIIAALTSGDPAAFLAGQRLDDTDGSAHFQLVVDLHALMQTDSFVNAVTAFATAQGNNLIIYNHADLAQIVRDNSALFENSSLTVDPYVGLDDHLLHRITLDLNLPLDPATLGYPDAPFTVTASLDLTLSDLNQPQTVAAPDDAQTVSSFTMPPLTVEAFGGGSLQYDYVETVGENATYTRAFDASAGDTVTITVRGLGLEFDPHVQLLSPDGEVLVENEDHETPAFGLGDYDAQIAQFVIPADGTYSIQVTEYDGAAGSFELTIFMQP